MPGSELVLRHHDPDRSQSIRGFSRFALLLGEPAASCGPCGLWTQMDRRTHWGQHGEWYSPRRHCDETVTGQ